MTRVIAGRLKGRRLSVPDAGTRPTTDRTREAIFARLESHNAILDANVLDLFAGSGALGIEALSRGASGATFVDSAPAAFRCIVGNLKDTALVDSSEVKRQTALTFLRSAGDEPQYDLVFVDPPYSVGESEIGQCLTLLAPIVSADSTVVVERDARSPEPTIPHGWEILGHKQWGDTAAWFVGPKTQEK